MEIDSRADEGDVWLQVLRNVVSIAGDAKSIASGILPDIVLGPQERFRLVDRRADFDESTAGADVLARRWDSRRRQPALHSI